MPTFERDGASIAYDVYGSGFPILLFAPGGMRSRAEMWPAPAGGPPRYWANWPEVLAKDYTVIAMDQRNAGRSRAPIKADDGWHSYAADHLGLTDHLGFKRFHTLGGCIGASYCLQLSKLVPDRIASAVLQNPIGVHPDFPNFFTEAFADWAKEQHAQRSDLDPSAVQSFGRNMWGSDFVFSVDRDFARRCPTPCIVLPGDDTPHPAVIGAELAEIIPNAERLDAWKGPKNLAEQQRRVVNFLAKHTPKN